MLLVKFVVLTLKFLTKLKLVGSHNTSSNGSRAWRVTPKGEVQRVLFFERIEVFKVRRLVAFLHGLETARVRRIYHQLPSLERDVVDEANVVRLRR